MTTLSIGQRIARTLLITAGKSDVNQKLIRERLTEIMWLQQIGHVQQSWYWILNNIKGLLLFWIYFIMVKTETDVLMYWMEKLSNLYYCNRIASQFSVNIVCYYYCLFCFITTTFLHAFPFDNIRVKKNHISKIWYTLTNLWIFKYPHLIRPPLKLIVSQ